MKYLLLSLLIVFGQNVFAQRILVTGSVTDTDDAPLIEATIKAQHSNFSLETTTDENGYFQLDIPDSNAKITISKAGYKNFSTEIASNTQLTIKLGYSELFNMSLEEILRTRVNTVSLLDEDISDAPGVVSVITGNELRNLGIRTVREALTLIPGFAPFQNDDEQILSVRGVFATTSQKILFMRNGHSLNEGNLDIPQMEFSISMENIKKIEIIRGPGGSIYGNSAFAAVVNIITIDEEQSRVKVTAGNHGYFETDGYLSKKINEKSHFIAWGRYALVKGEEMNVSYNPSGTSNLKEGSYKTYNYPGNYDAGFQYVSNNINTSISARRHEYNTYWSTQGAYTHVDSLFWQPHLSQTSVHFDLTFNYELTPKINATLQNYYDYSTLTNVRLTDSINTSGGYPMGKIQANEWNVIRTGMNYYLNWNYLPQGNFIAGLAYEYRKYLDSWILSNDNDTFSLNLPTEFYPKSSENRLAGFVQINHKLTDWLKLDIGARYDIAEQYSAAFNPRLAIIYTPVEKLTIKAMYTKAFQAPGYSYRLANTNAEFSGSLGDLRPEIINTYQASVRYNIKNASFIDLSVYYNKLENMIARNADSGYYANFGKLATYGIESDAHINYRSHTFFFSYALLLPATQHMNKAFIEKNIYNNRFKNIPTHSVNSGIMFQIANNVVLSIYEQYTSAFYASDNSQIDDKIITNSTLRILNIAEYFETSISVYNLTDKKYYLGDPSLRPLPQPGRWISFSLIMNFK